MTTQHNSHLTAPYFPLYRRGALFSSANRGVGVVLRFDPEDQAVLSPALNTAFVFPGRHRDGIRPRERLLDRIFPDFLLDLPLGEGVSWHCHLGRSVRHKRPVGRERNCYERTSHSLESPGSGPPPGREPGGPRRGGGNRDRRGGPANPGGHRCLLRRPVRRRAKPAIRAVAGWGDRSHRPDRHLLPVRKSPDDRGRAVRHRIRQQDLHHRGGDAAGGGRQGVSGRPGDPVSAGLQNGGRALQGHHRSDAAEPLLRHPGHRPL